MMEIAAGKVKKEKEALRKTMENNPEKWSSCRLPTMMLFNAFIIMSIIILSSRNIFDTSRLIESNNNDKMDIFIEELKCKLNKILTNSNNKNEEAYENAISEMNKINNIFEQAEEGVEKVVDELASHNGCVVLIYYLLKDFINGTDEAELYINEIIKTNIRNDLLYAIQMKENILLKLNDAFKKNRADMLVSIAHIGDSVPDLENFVADGAFDDFTKRTDTVSETFSAIAYETVFSEIGLSITAIMAKTVYGQAKNVLIHIVRRIRNLTGIAVVSAAADGPFPIGDTIAVALEIVSVVWCAHDLYEARVVLKGQVEEELGSALAQYRKDLFDLSERQSLELLDAYNSLSHQTVQELLVTIS